MSHTAISPYAAADVYYAASLPLDIYACFADVTLCAFADTRMASQSMLRLLPRSDMPLCTQLPFFFFAMLSLMLLFRAAAAIDAMPLPRAAMSCCRRLNGAIRPAHALLRFTLLILRYFCR